MTAANRRVCWLAVATAAGFTIAGCAASTGNSSAACASLLTFHGQAYVGTTLNTHPPYDKEGLVPSSHLRKIGKATQPACHDTNVTGADNPGSQPQQVEVARIDEVDPGVAIAILPRGNVYLKRGAALPGVLTTAPWIHWYTTD